MPRIWLAIVLSLLVHVAAILKLPQFRLTPAENVDRGDTRGPMMVRLAPRPEVEPAPPEPAPPLVLRPERTPPRAAPPSREPPRRKDPPPVIALEKKAPEAPPPQRAAPVPTPSPPRAVPDSDFASYVEARRRARGETAPPAAPAEAPAGAPAAEDPNARANRIAAANLGLDRTPSFGSARQPGGGIFGIERLTYDYAEFVFYGWNKDIRRNTTQRIEVRKGNNADIRIAVVRRMIVIIREHEQGDFVWESLRLGRNVTLSARTRDNAGLEEFMMREFFGDDRRPLTPR